MKTRIFSTALAGMLLALIWAWLPSEGVAAPPDGGEEVSSNNLSYPAVFTGAGVTLNGTEGQYSLGGAFPASMSYGCAKEETIGTSVYPNTSCVDTAGVPLGYEACAAGPCAGFVVEQIYWQKTAANLWQAETVLPPLNETIPRNVTYVDWGDNLETVTWSTRSVIRVETTPFATLSLLGDPSTQLGFQMWHVFGQGPSELWGVHAAAAGAPYVYGDGVNSVMPYAIIHSHMAMVNIAKLEAGASACPTAYTPAGFAPVWNAVTHEWSDACTVHNIPYTAELNIGGKFVYGYNWMLRRDAMCPGYDKAGWWRLTFYTSDDSVVFDNAAIPLAPPALPAACPAGQLCPAPAAAILPAAEESDTGPLYQPVVVSGPDNLTYIDICIGTERGGGGGGGGGGKPTGAGGGTRPTR